MSELQFSALVDELKSDPVRSTLLVDLLREDNPIYDQRGTAAITRMRGWVLLAFERLGLPGAALIFVLEELDNGRDAYLVAAAARSLRSCANPGPAMAAFLMRALANIQFHDDRVSLDRYGGYAISPLYRGETAAKENTGATTAVDELLATLRWLGSDARDAVPAMEALLADSAKGGGTFSTAQTKMLSTILQSVRPAEPAPEPLPGCCTLPHGIGAFREWIPASCPNRRKIESIAFEDQDGKRITFRDFFRGQPSVVAFFYTRCTNPLKCSLTVTKLARLQKLLITRRLSGRIRTAAITYDPEFDLAERLRGYGESRGMHIDADNRILRTMEGIEPLQKYFGLGVNFIHSLVNRHRVEVYILDTAGKIAASFERIQWDENEVLDRAANLLAHANSRANIREKAATVRKTRFALPATLSMLSLATAFFPKCPVCWAAYLSIFGITGLEQLPYSPWFFPIIACLMLINLGCLWLQQRRRQGVTGFHLAAAGAVLIVPGIILELGYASAAGILLTITGSAISVSASRRSTGSIGPTDFAHSQTGQTFSSR
ncbi:MAG TPA: SCO family protein [Nitrosospira sp.]